MELQRVPQDLVVGWNETLVRWSTKESHDTLLGRAVKHGQLAWIATRYREAARSNPRDPIARDRLKAVQRAAAMLVFATPAREPVRKTHSGFVALLVGLALSTVVGLWATRYMRDHRAATLVSRQP
jgi:hypothetical protein